MTLMGKNIGVHPSHALEVAVSSKEKHESVGLHMKRKSKCKMLHKSPLGVLDDPLHLSEMLRLKSKVFCIVCWQHWHDLVLPFLLHTQNILTVSELFTRLSQDQTCCPLFSSECLSLGLDSLVTPSKASLVTFFKMVWLLLWDKLWPCEIHSLKSHPKHFRLQLYLESELVKRTLGWSKAIRMGLHTIFMVTVWDEGEDP